MWGLRGAGQTLHPVVLRITIYAVFSNGKSDGQFRRNEHRRHAGGGWRARQPHASVSFVGSRFAGGASLWRMPNGVVLAAKGVATIYHAGDTDVFTDMTLIAHLLRRRSPFFPSATGSRWGRGCRDRGGPAQAGNDPALSLPDVSVAGPVRRCLSRGTVAASAFKATHTQARRAAALGCNWRLVVERPTQPSRT